MQRILQPGEIEALDHTSFPRTLLPNTSSIFLDRANRIRQLANGNPIADYLGFVAELVQAQHLAAQNLVLQPIAEAAIARAQEFSSPLLPAAEHIDPIWHQVLDTMLKHMAAAPGLPAALQPLIHELKIADTEMRDGIAKRLLTKEMAARDVGMAPFVMAALQVVFTCRASLVNAADVPYTQPATICPVCAAEPVASVLRIGGKQAGHRYLHCGCCATEWHMVRIKCSHCESTEGVRYQGIDGEKGVVLAETCDTCNTYRKIVNQEKDPLAEPLADDLASLMLDLLMSDTKFQRATSNPLLYVAVTEAQDDDASSASVPDLH